MRAQERKVRIKPSVAFASEEIARENIKVKLHSLLELLKTFKTASAEEQVVILEDLPTSHRSFNGWASEQLSTSTRKEAESFHSNSRVALHRSGMLERVDKALASVVAERSSVRSPKKREEAVAALARKLKLEAQLRKIGEDEVVRLKRKVKSLVETCDDLKMQLQAANREALILSKGIQSMRQSGSGRVVELSTVPSKSKPRESKK